MNAPLDHGQICGTPVVWANEPFGDYLSRFERPGMTIAQIVAATPNLPDAFDEFGIVAVGDVAIPKEWWPYVRPRNDRGPVVVQIGIELRGGGGGGGGGKSTLRTVAMIALLVAAVAVGQFEVLGALGTIYTTASGAAITGAQLLGAGLATAALAVGAISAPPSLGALESANSGPSSGPQQGAASLSGNVLAPGQPAPQVVGEGMRVFPVLLAPVLVKRDGLDEIAEAVYGLAGPHMIWSPRFGAADATQSDGVEMEIIEALPGDPPLSLVNRYGYTEQVSSDLVRHRVQAGAQDLIYDQQTPSNSYPIWTPIASRTASDEIWITLVFEGPAQWSSPGSGMTTPLRIRMREIGSDVWINLPEFFFRSNNGTGSEATIEFYFKAAPLLQPVAPANKGFVAAHKVVPGQTRFPASAGWQADSYFSRGAGSDVYVSSAGTTHNVSNVLLYEDKIEVYLDPSTFSRGVYDIQIIQGLTVSAASFSMPAYAFSGTVYDLFGSFVNGADYAVAQSRADIKDKVTIDKIATVINEPPVIGNDFARIAVRAKNKPLGQFSVMAAAYIPTYNGTEWTGLAVSGNPANHFRHVLKTAITRRDGPVDLIDDVDMADWHALCVTRGYKVNAVLQNTNVLAAMDLIASCGYGRKREAEKYGVTVDYQRSGESPITTFSPRTIKDFAWRKPLADLPDGYLVRYRNQDKDFREDTVLVLRPGAVNRGNYEETSNDGMTATADVVTRATFDLRQLTERMIPFTWVTNQKNKRLRRGSLVAVSHDRLSRRTGYARVTATIGSGGILAGLVLDAGIPTPSSEMWSGEDDQWALYSEQWSAPRFGLVLERLDGSISVHEIVEDELGESRIVLFTTPFSDPGLEVIGPDCAVATGFLGEEYKRLLIDSIEYAEDGTATISAVDEGSLFNPDGSVALN